MRVGWCWVCLGEGSGCGGGAGGGAFKSNGVDFSWCRRARLEGDNSREISMILNNSEDTKTRQGTLKLELVKKFE